MIRTFSIFATIHHKGRFRKMLTRIFKFGCFSWYHTYTCLGVSWSEGKNTLLLPHSRHLHLSYKIMSITLQCKSSNWYLPNANIDHWPKISWDHYFFLTANKVAGFRTFPKKERLTICWNMKLFTAFRLLWDWKSIQFIFISQ